MARQRKDCGLSAGFCEYLESLRLEEGMVTPQEAGQKVALLRRIRARIDEEISWLRARADQLPKEPVVGFPELNFTRPMGAPVSTPDEE